MKALDIFIFPLNRKLNILAMQTDKTFKRIIRHYSAPHQTVAQVMTINHLILLAVKKKKKKSKVSKWGE